MQWLAFQLYSLICLSVCMWYTYSILSRGISEKMVTYSICFRIWPNPVWKLPALNWDVVVCCFCSVATQLTNWNWSAWYIKMLQLLSLLALFALCACSSPFSWRRPPAAGSDFGRWAHHPLRLPGDCNRLGKCVCVSVCVCVYLCVSCRVGHKNVQLLVGKAFKLVIKGYKCWRLRKSKRITPSLFMNLTLKELLIVEIWQACMACMRGL